MNDNEKVLRALACISTELYLQNEILVAKLEGFAPGYDFANDKIRNKLTTHFQSFFEGGGFSPGSIAKFTPRRSD